MQLAECGSVSFMQFDGDVVCTRRCVEQRGVMVLYLFGCVCVCVCVCVGVWVSKSKWWT